MATLTNTKIKDTYDGLLKTTNAEAIGASGVTLIEDGLGNASALSVGRSGNGVTITGSLNATLATAAQTNITSVGTLSSLAVSGNLTVDTNTLFVDAANNWVGIGTSSPSRPIHILAPTPGIKLEDTTGNDFGEIVSVDGDLYIRADEGATQADSSIRFQIDQSEKVRIDSSGNVGIGTSSPAEKLDVRNGTIVSRDDSNVNYAELDRFDGLTLRGNGSGAKYVSTPNTDALAFKTNATERMRISSSGNVSIASGILELAAQAEIIGSSDNLKISADPNNVSGGSTIEFLVDGSEKMRILSTGGLTFNGDTAAANALDDYEEGNWTPVYVPTTGSFATMTMDVLNATYTKIGRLVTIVAQIRTDDVDVTGGSGNVLISGLPYTAVVSIGGGGAISVGFTSDFVNAPTAGGFTQNGTTIILRVGTTPMAVADLTDGTSPSENRLYFAASYFTS
jgi:hypothetical protein